MDAANSEEKLQNKGAVPSLELHFRDSLDDGVNKPIPWIFANLLAEREQMLVYGEPKIGKSQFALQMAVAAAMGRSFLHWEYRGEEDAESKGKKPRRVLYVNFEIDEQAFSNRLADHVLAELDQQRAQPEQVESLESAVLLRQDQIELINEQIKERLFFSDGIRSMGITEAVIYDELKETQDPVASWRDRIRALRPDLVVFDTLSKVHSVKEQDNIEIQQVLMLLRKIAVVVNDDGKTVPVAHVIVHHTRKGWAQGSVQDSIRGASSIRAEVDVSAGLTQRKPTRSRRMLDLEARNMEGGSFHLSFNGKRFEVAAAKEEISPATQEIDDLSRIEGAFEKAGVRSMATKQLLIKALGKEQTRNAEGSALKKFIEEGAKEGKFFVLLEDKQQKQRALESGPMLKGAMNSDLYWIPDGSPWMNTPWMRSLMAEFRKPPDGGDASSDEPAQPGRASKPVKRRGRRRKHSSRGASSPHPKALAK